MPKIRTYGLDVDTISYAKRVKDGSGRDIDQKHLIDINRFVIGIKRMGLWDKMVCWPMRSIHNAGTGSTVYSLGGLGVYNGTVSNFLMWDTMGIVFPPNLAGCKIDTLFGVETEGSCIASFNTVENLTSRAIAFFGQATNSAGGFPLVYSVGGSQNISVGQATTPPSVLHQASVVRAFALNRFLTFAATWKPSNADYYENGLKFANNISYGVSGHQLQQGYAMNNIILLNSYGAWGQRGNTTIHNHIIITHKALGENEQAAVYNLTKQTITRGIN